MTRKDLTKNVREFFRKRREYMSGRIDTACHSHFGDARIDSVEAESTVLEFVEGSLELIDSIRSRAQIDVEEPEAARAFVKERVHNLHPYYLTGSSVREEAAQRLGQQHHFQCHKWISLAWPILRDRSPVTDELRMVQ